MKRGRAPSWLLRQPIAHRGLHDAARPENSLAAFEAAADRGYPVELDVRSLADGAVAVFHDDDLRRMTGVQGPIGELSAGDVERLRLSGRAHPIPLLRHALEAIAGRVPVVIDLKSPDRVGALEHAVVTELRGYRGEFVLQSFNPLALWWLRRKAPHIRRGLLASDFGDSELAVHKKFVLRRLLLAPLADPDYIGYDLRCLPYWAPALARRLGIPLLAWTVESPADQRLAARVADNFIFEGFEPRTTAAAM